jgi:monosaccharide-transporting ATPase
MLTGRPVAPRSTQEAQALGISTVYQEVNLCPNLSVAENIFIGRYPRKWGGGRLGRMRAEATKLLAKRLQIDIDVGKPLATYPLAIQQMVAIARALNMSRVLILDEPTSSLDEAEVQTLFAVLRRLREEGMAILFVTHFLDQTYAISDRITVMRNGEREGEYACAELSRLALVNKMIGAPADAQEEARCRHSEQRERRRGVPARAGDRAQGRAGAAGPRPAPRRAAGPVPACWAPAAPRPRACCSAPTGLTRRHRASMASRVSLSNPRDAIAAGIGFCSEDRKHEGAILPLSVRENMVLACRRARASGARSRSSASSSWPTTTSNGWASRPRASRRRSARSRAATSRRCCWRAGWRPSRR